MNTADSISSHLTSVPFLFLQKDPTEQSELQYDEFGFRVDAEGKLLSQQRWSSSSRILLL